MLLGHTGPPDHPLNQPWRHVRFIAKAFIVVVATMTVTLLFKNISKPVDEARAAVYARWWGAPLLFVAFVPPYLVYELVRFRLWRARDRAHPDPCRRPAKRPGGPPPRRSGGRDR